MAKVSIRPTHNTYHREGSPPRMLIQSDATTAYVRIEFAGSPQLIAPTNQSQRTRDNYFDSWVGGDGVSGQQLRLNQGKLIYNMPLVVWRRLGQNNHHIHYRASVNTASSPDWSAQPPTVSSILDRYVTLGYVPYFGATHDRLHTPWPFPDSVPLNRVPEFYRTRLQLLTRHSESHEGAYLLRRLVGHDNYTSLPEAQRTKALHVFAAIENAARRAYLQLFGRQIPPTSTGAQTIPAVSNTDLSSQHNTLLDNLASVVEFYPHMDIPDRLDVIIAELVQEVANPHFEINQGTKGTCVPTSVQWIITTYFPSEYIRLMVMLLSQDSRATLANGHQATVPLDTYRFDPREDSANVSRYTRRSWSERIFQATMMNYARPGLTYSNLLDVFTDNRGGLTPQELVRLMNGLRNRNHTVQNGSGSDLMNLIAQGLQSPSLPILTGMTWGAPGPSQGGHRVVSVSADSTSVTIRNPWGRSNYRVGQQHLNPPRRSTNPMRGEETITQTNMANWVTNIVVEQT